MKQTERYLWVMRRADDIARAATHEVVELEDVAVALLESTGVAAAVLMRLSIRSPELRLKVIAESDLPELRRPGLLHWLKSRWNEPPQLMGVAVASLSQQAAVEATELNHNYIGTEHLLLALLLRGGKVADVLSAAGANYDAVRRTVRQVLRHPD